MHKQAAIQKWSNHYPEFNNKEYPNFLLIQKQTQKFKLFNIKSYTKLSYATSGYML